MSHKIYEACSKGNFNEVQNCLENPAVNKTELLSTRFDPYHKRTLLHTAALHGHDRIVQLLIDHGADVNCITKFAGDLTPLHLAVHGKHKSCVEVLLNHKDIDVTAIDGTLKRTPYEHALEVYSKVSPIPVMLKTAGMFEAQGAAKAKNIWEAGYREMTPSPIVLKGIIK